MNFDRKLCFKTLQRQSIWRIWARFWIIFRYHHFPLSCQDVLFNLSVQCLVDVLWIPPKIESQAICIWGGTLYPDKCCLQLSKLKTWVGFHSYGDSTCRKDHGSCLSFLTDAVILFLRTKCVQGGQSSILCSNPFYTLKWRNYIHSCIVTTET